MSLKPLKKHLIITKNEETKTTTGGIILQGATMLDPASIYATVVSVGKDVTIDVSPGDEIVPDWRGCAPIKYEDKMYYLIHEDNIHGVFTDGN
jgi:co-chaperonin GroES (HSP10)